MPLTVRKRISPDEVSPAGTGNLPVRATGGCDREHLNAEFSEIQPDRDFRSRFAAGKSQNAIHGQF